jgi:hypothetical protein
LKRMHFGTYDGRSIWIAGARVRGVGGERGLYDEPLVVVRVVCVQYEAVPIGMPINMRKSSRVTGVSRSETSGLEPELGRICGANVGALPDEMSSPSDFDTAVSPSPPVWLHGR